MDNNSNAYDSNVITEDKVNVDCTEDDCYECLLNRLQTPDWAKENS